MITFIAFLLMVLGSINWLLIGLLQYDFIAGLFGFQASIFSRMVYILFGIGAVYFVIRIIANKGDVKVFERKKSKKEREEMKLQKREQKLKGKNEKDSKSPTPAYANIEAGKEFRASNFNGDEYSSEKHFDFDNKQSQEHFVNMQNPSVERHFSDEDNLFDEHFDSNN